MSSIPELDSQATVQTSAPWAVLVISSIYLQHKDLLPALIHSQHAYSSYGSKLKSCIHAAVKANLLVLWSQSKLSNLFPNLLFDDSNISYYTSCMHSIS